MQSHGGLKDGQQLGRPESQGGLQVVSVDGHEAEHYDGRGVDVVGRGFTGYLVLQPVCAQEMGGVPKQGNRQRHQLSLQTLQGVQDQDPYVS